MKLLAYIIHSKMILQVMLKGDKMATSHLILKDHLTKIPCTNMIKDICITFKVAHIIQVTCPHDVLYHIWLKVATRFCIQSQNITDRHMPTSHLILKDHSTKIPCTNVIKDICITFKVTHISFKWLVPVLSLTFYICIV